MKRSTQASNASLFRSVLVSKTRDYSENGFEFCAWATDFAHPV